MPAFSKLSAVAFVASSVIAAPWDFSSQHSTHKRHVGAGGVEFTTYHPPVTYETLETPIQSLHTRGQHDVLPSAAAVSYLAAKLNVDPSTLHVQSGYSSDTATHVYVGQSINNVTVANGVANVVFNKDGSIVAYGSSLVQPAQVSSTQPKISEAQAIAAAEQHLGGRYNSHPVKTEYVFQETNHATFAYVVQVKNDKSWFEAFVDASSGQIVNVVDFVAHASYSVVPWNQQDYTWSGFKLVQNPALNASSPHGWHQDNKGSYTATKGNNVIAYHGSTSGTTKQSATGLVFNYTWNPTTAPSTTANLNAARVNAFYIANSYHDLLYQYGFTEQAYNFQNDNFGKSGKGADAVEMEVQASGTDNANFATPPDGQPGHCNMYLWDLTSPERDGDVSNDVITHEFTHGLTNRMTGGGTGRCLSTTEAGGMGEGWSDTLSFWTEQNSTAINDFTLGVWVYDNPEGIRTVPYSTNMQVDPYTYATVKTQNEVHAIGEIWATMLIEVYAALVGQYGFSANFFNPNQTQGNIMFLHLLVDALPLQPCSPTFLTARDAIILADKNRYAGANMCLLWTAFAKRGLGPKAAKYVNDMSLPAGC